MFVSNSALSISEIVSLVKSLNPSLAASSTIDENLCATPIFKEVKDGYHIIPLNNEEGKIGVGYVRVSSENQKEDGFSIPDQASRIISYFINKRQQFIVFSDAGLSGGLPPRNGDLIKKILKTKSDRYERIFNSVFFGAGYERKYSKEQIESINEYISTTKARILKGESVLEDEDLGNRQKKNVYRPGFSLLLQNLKHFHTLAITDISRLSRNKEIFQYIIEQLADEDIEIKGMIQNLDMLNSKDGMSRVIRNVMIIMSELKLEEILINSLRGLMTLLEEGKPHGKIPQWLYRDREGYAQLKPGADLAINRAIELYLEKDEDNDERGIYRICRILDEEGYKPFTQSKMWNSKGVRDMLLSKSLLGIEENFGLEYKIFPQFIDEETYFRLQQKFIRQQKNYRKYYKEEKKKGHLATGLFRCGCGKTLVHVISTNESKTEQYHCIVFSHGGYRDKSVNHLKMSYENVNSFLDELMRHSSRIILNIYNLSQDYQQLKQDIKNKEQELFKMQYEISIKEKEIKNEIKEKVKGMGINEDNSAFSVLCDGFIKAESDFTYKEIKSLEDEINRLQSKLSMMVPDERIADIEERAAKWDTMTTNEKNRLLHQIFQGFYYNAENESFLPILKSGVELHEVKLNISGEKAKRRRLPEVEEYTLSMLD